MSEVGTATCAKCDEAITNVGYEWYHDTGDVCMACECGIELVGPPGKWVHRRPEDRNEPEICWYDDDSPTLEAFEAAPLEGAYPRHE